MTEQFNHVPFNVAIKSSQLGDAGRSLSVIAQHLGSAYGTLVKTVSDLTAQATEVTRVLDDAVFYLNWSRLQFEMTLIYYRELIAMVQDPDRDVATRSLTAAHQNLHDLRAAFQATARATTTALGTIDQALQQLNSRAADLGKTMMSLQVSQVAGLIEVSRLEEQTEIVDIFDDIRAHIQSTQKRLVRFTAAIDQLANLASATPAVTAAITAATRKMQNGETALTCTPPVEPAEPGTHVTPPSLATTTTPAQCKAVASEPTLSGVN
jgi:hypothetical protein